MGIEPKSFECYPIVNSFTPNAIQVSTNVDSFTDSVIVHKDIYEYYFGKKTLNPNNYRKPRVVKIKYDNRTIYRRMVILSASGLDTKKIGLTYNSIGELTTHTQHGLSVSPKNDMVEIARGSVLLFWLRHPNPAAQISFILGFWSIIIGVFSIIISLVLYRCT